MVTFAIEHFIFIFVALSFIIVGIFRTKEFYKVRICIECLLFLFLISFETINAKLFNSAIKINYAGYHSLSVEVQQLWMVFEEGFDKAIHIFAFICIILSCCSLCRQIKIKLDNHKRDIINSQYRARGVNPNASYCQSQFLTRSANICGEFCRSNQ